MKLDLQHRIAIPLVLIKSTGLDKYLSECRELRLAVKEDHMVLFKPCEENDGIEYCDVVNVDSKNRICLHASVWDMIGKGSDFEHFEYFVSALRDHLIIRWKKGDV